MEKEYVIWVAEGADELAHQEGRRMDGPITLEKITNTIDFNQMCLHILDSNKFSIGIHFFKVLVQIHYSPSPLPREHLEENIII